MTLDESTKLIKSCAEKLNARSKRVVFDEWAVVSVAHKRSRILQYLGPRNEDFLKTFANALGALRKQLPQEDVCVGDFEFARQGAKTIFEAFMVLADDIYLICNNTAEAADGADSRRTEAKGPLAELSERVRQSPLVCGVEFN